MLSNSKVSMLEKKHAIEAGAICQVAYTWKPIKPSFMHITSSIPCEVLIIYAMYFHLVQRTSHGAKGIIPKSSISSPDLARVMKYPWFGWPRKNCGVTLWEFLGLVSEMRCISLLIRRNTLFKSIYCVHWSSRMSICLRVAPRRGRGGRGHTGRIKFTSSTRGWYNDDIMGILCQIFENWEAEVVARQMKSYQIN